MKKISILGILAILVIVAEFTYAMIAGWVDMKNSFLGICGCKTFGNDSSRFLDESFCR